MAELKVVALNGHACVHHWMLADPSEGQIAGYCRRCAAKKVFPASPESTQRFDDYRELTAASGYARRLSA